MRTDYRQGIVRYQTDISNNPSFLLKDVGGASVSLVVSTQNNNIPDSTLITAAHGIDTDYLFGELETVPAAWSGFTGGTDYWLYWDINVATGVRTFGSTTVQPFVGPTAPSPIGDQHWFDTSEFVHKVYVGSRWVTFVRVFAGKYASGSVLEPEGLNSQAGLNNSIRPGFILFDSTGAPVKKFDRFNRGVFFTTESPLSSQTSMQSNFRLEAAIVEAPAAEHIPRFSAVAYIQPGKLGLARPGNTKHPAVGIAQDDFATGARRSFISRGHVRDSSFNWTQAVNTPLFVGATGELTATIPQSISIQQVATVVSPKVIYVDIHPQILYG